MDIPTLNQLSAQVGNQLASNPDILISLRRLGGIDATVLRVAKGEVLLATRLGEIIGKNALDLKTGDQIRIKVGGMDSNPVLKVSRPIAERIILSTPHPTALSRALIPNKPQMAMVLVHTPKSTDIALNGNRHSFKQLVELKTGQLISLRYRPEKNHIEVKPINTGQVLKSALTRLLPKTLQAGSSNSLVSLVKTLQSLAPGQQADKSTGHSPVALKQNNAASPGSATSNSALIEKGDAQTQLITRLLVMLQSLPRISTLDRTVIQQWAEFISPGPYARGIGNTDLENPFSLLKQLPTNEASLRPLLQQWAKQISTFSRLTPHSSSQSEASGDESYSNIAKNILKLVEQSLSHHQFQQTSVRYQQEQQQPINLSLTIPVTEDEATGPLHINIRQRKSSVENEDNTWDINLNFEFGGLGLISSHITLDGNTISTTFWASREDTRLKIDNALPDFKRQLLTAGLEPGQFFSLKGPDPMAAGQDRPYRADTLLDIKV